MTVHYLQRGRVPARPRSATRAVMCWWGRFLLTVVVGISWASLCGGTRVRLLGMGDLSVAVEDESNLINLYDFGGNVAGLRWDEERSCFEGGLSYSTREGVDTNGVLKREFRALGDPFPPHLVQVTGLLPYPLLLAEGGPVWGLPSGGSLVYRTLNSAVEASGSFSQQSSDSSDYSRRTSTPCGSIRLNHLWGEAVSLGLLAGCIRPEQTDTRENVESSVTDFAGGVGVAIRLGEMAELGGKVDYDRLEMEKEYLGCHTATSFRGNSVEGGIQGVLRLPAGFKGGVDLSYGKLSADGERRTSRSTNQIGPFEQVQSQGRARALTPVPLLPVQLGVSASYEMVDVVFEPTGEYDPELGLNRTYTDILLGIGALYSVSRLLVGAELHYRLGRERDNEQDRVVKSRLMGGNLGAELSAGELVSLRGGWATRRDDPNLADEEQGSLEHRFTGGVGFALPGESVKGDLAYSQTRLFPDIQRRELRATDNLFSLAVKFFF